MSKQKESLDYYLELGEQGFYPLFFRDWIIQVDLKQMNKKYKGKELDLETFFKQVDKHKQIDRKKLVMSALSKNQRDQIIFEFFRKIDLRLQKSKYKFH